MTVETYSSLPFTAGGALAGAVYRSALSGAGVFMRQPLRNSAIVGLIGLCVLAGGNALYRQHHLPAPLFGSFESTDANSAAPAHSVRETRPVMPIERPARLAIDGTETTGTIGPAPTATPSTSTAPSVIGHDDVVAVQKKLAALNLFGGNADGLFGAKTSAAIKAFEQSVGRPAKGLLTPQIIALIAAAPLPQAIAPPASIPPAKSAAAPASPQTLTKTVATAPALPAPSPLAPADKSAASAASLAPAVSSQPVVAPSQPADASSAVDDAAAAPAMQTGSLAPVAKRTVQTIAVHAEPSQPLPSQLAPPQNSNEATNDPDVVASVQRGLNSLGFLRGNISGIADEATAKAVRNFEVFYNYDVTGRVTKALVDLLKLNGATV